MHIVQFGSIDVASYGDLLFPLVAAHRLGDLATRMTFLSPSGGAVLRWPDAVASEPIDVALREGFTCDACLIGGGDIVATSPSPLPNHMANGITSHLALPALWLGAALVAERTGATLVWNAPGVPRAFTDPRLTGLVSSALAASDYVSVRDPISLANLGGGADGASVAIVPDTALDVARVWPRADLRTAFQGVFAARARAVAERTAVFHVNQGSAQPAEQIAASIARMAESIACSPILLSIEPCHGDDAWVRDVSAKLAVPHLLVDRPGSLRDIAACLAYSECYVGSSPHGFLTAFAYGNKGLVVSHPAQRRLDGVPVQLGLPDAACPNWTEAERRLGPVLADAEQRWPAALERAHAALDEHWARVRDVLLAGSGDGSRIRKASFARRLAAFNDENGGWIARLAGVMELDAARHRPPPGGRLFDIEPQIIQGVPHHVSQEETRLILHPPGKGVTEVCFSRIPLTGGETIRGGVTVAHAQGQPVRFAMLLVDAEGRTVATGEVTAQPRAVSSWKLDVPANVNAPCHLFVSTRMAQPTDTTRFAWATLIDPAVELPVHWPASDRAERRDPAQAGLANTSGGAAQEMPGTDASAANSESSIAQASSCIAR